MKKLIALSLLALASLGAHAAGVGTGTVTALYPMHNGVLLVDLSAAVTGRPACATQAARFAVDGNTVAGKQQVSAVMLAFALGKTVGFNGTGNCAVWADSEGLLYLLVLQ